MSATLTRIVDTLVDSSGSSDPRMNRFLMKSPLQVISIVALYLTLIFKIGPIFMKNRKPFSLRTTIIAYNVIQIVLNAAIFLKIFPLRSNLSLLCTPPDTSNSDTNLLEIEGHYYYILLKYFDLVETLFYVLRKKDRQISFLHVYHHIGILAAAWISGKYFPGGQAMYVAMYNTVIHGIMYCYYLMSSWGGGTGGFLWWKKYVTALQIIQHCLIFISVFPSVVNMNCSYPKGWMAAFSVNVIVIIYLFGKFYKETYLTKAKQK
ncbi:very long chain fatty acid elongase AAEL008004-like [Zophobas morio]|uniref:very long chain fatty acid elongase AAEL008004-like n=1 Tax=Zophobas morio TaxID=2755281 RepID=UPI003082C60F